MTEFYLQNQPTLLIVCHALNSELTVIQLWHVDFINLSQTHVLTYFL